MQVRFPTPLLAIALAATALTGCTRDAVGPTAPSASVAPHATGSVTLAWHGEARARVSAARMSPLAAARVYAALGVAQHRAVESLDRSGVELLASLEGFGPGGRRLAEAERGAVAGASARVLGFFFPGSAGSHEQMVAAQGEAGPGMTHPHYARGVAAGRAAGDAIVARLMADRFTTPWTGPAPTGDGIFTPVVLPPAGGTYGGVQPWYMTTGAQFRPAPPPAWDSPAFAAELAEVEAMSQARTPAQQAIVLKWDLSAGTPTPIGYWNQEAAEYVDAAGLGEREASRVFAVMQAAVMDALIGCWDAKYEYWTIRPSQASGLVQLGLPLPNHPSYPSGHSCGSAAAAGVLAEFFPDRAADLEAQVEEAGLSRILAGIHYRFDIVAGKQIGRQAAALALSRGAP